MKLNSLQEWKSGLKKTDVEKLARKHRAKNFSTTTATQLKWCESNYAHSIFVYSFRLNVLVIKIAFHLNDWIMIGVIWIISRLYSCVFFLFSSRLICVPLKLLIYLHGFDLERLKWIWWTPFSHSNSISPKPQT